MREDRKKKRERERERELEIFARGPEIWNLNKIGQLVLGATLRDKEKIKN